MTTRDLRPNLFVFFADRSPAADVNSFLSANPGVALAFQPLFSGTLSGSTYSSAGLSQQLSVDVTTGAVSVGNAAPVPLAPVRSSFIVEISLQVPGLPEPLRQEIRIQVHRAVQQVWLTPSTLLIQKDSTPAAAANARFTVRAQFTDDIVGDVTQDHGVIWTGVPSGHVTADGGLVVLAADTVGDEIPVFARLPPNLGGHVTPVAPAPFAAKMVVAPAWSSAPPRASLVVGGGVPSAARPPEISPNVLFVSDGFVAAQQPLYDQMIDTIVDRLRHSAFTRPYDLLSDSINFWKVFVPSVTAGLSCRDEVYTHLVDGKVVATPLPAGQRPVDSGAWKVHHLAYVIGYPVTANGDGSATPATLRAAWVAMLNKPWSERIADASVVSDEVILEWRTLAARSSIDEVDGGFPGMAMGRPPAASLRAEALLGLHTDRGYNDMLDDFLLALQADDGTTLKDGRALGALWRRPSDPSFAFDNTELVVLLSSYPGGRPVNHHRSIALGTDPQTEVIKVTPISGRNALSLDLLPPSALRTEVPYVVAHELGHSFGLGDEYQNFQGRHPQLLDSDLDTFSNLQFETAVRSGRSGPLQSSSIKWNWPRIRAAAVVTGAITAESGGSRFRVPVADIDGFLFAVGDHVLLRLRKPREPIGMKPVVALGLTHEAEVVGPLVGGSVLLKAANGSALAFADLAPFVPGSVMFAPTPARPSVKTPSYPYAEMVAKNVRDYIDANDKPLTALPCKFDEESIVAPILPGVAIRSGFCRLFTPHIVGLYAGGERYSCGVFHPTGFCVMAPKGLVEFKSFCPVCRYILVDFIEPRFHGAIDEDYDKIYPQP